MNLQEGKCLYKTKMDNEKTAGTHNGNLQLNFILLTISILYNRDTEVYMEICVDANHSLAKVDASHTYTRDKNTLGDNRSHRRSNDK